MSHKTEHNYYSWMIGFMEGLTIGIVHEVIESETPTDYDDFIKGLNYGYNDAL